MSNVQTGNKVLWLVIALLVISATLNVGLGRVVLSSRHEAATSANGPIGEVMPPIRAVDLNGGAATLFYGSASVPTVIYVFSPNCKFCQKNAHNLAALAGQISGRFRIIGISLTTKDVGQFALEHDMRFPIYTNVDAAVKKAFHMGGTPQTFVVGRDGRLQKMWRGAYGSSNQKSLEDFFGLQLPGFPS